MHAAFLYSSTCSVDIIKVFFFFFFWFQFFQQKVSKPTKIIDKDHLFCNSLPQKNSLILRTSTHLTLKIFCYRNTAKNLSHFTNFPANMFLFGVRKKNCNGPFLDIHELHSSSTLKANICIFLYISLRKFLFQRRSKTSSGGIGGGWRLNNFVKAAPCLDIVKCFTMLHLNWNFSKFSNSTSPTLP